MIGDFPAELTVSYSDVEGGEAGVFVQSGFILNWGAGNIDRDPQFVEPGSGDYRLAAGSSCIDVGHNWGVPADGTDLDSDGDTSELTPLDLGDPPFMIRKLSRRTFEAIRGMGEQQPLSIGTLEKRLASTWRCFAM